MKKVSIISPCYNGEKYLSYFLESLTKQNYSNVEFIFVNDGSTDKTKDIFLNFKPNLEKKGWSVIYIEQKNAGQAAALNKGLEIFTGDYLLWPDSDDILFPNHLEKKVSFMEEHPQLGLAFCQLEEVSEKNIDIALKIIERIPATNDDLFNDLLNNHNILWPPISSIVRSSALLDVLSNRKIYEGKGGQNFQILLPLSSKYKAGYIKEPLGKYVIREASHSRSQKDFIKRQNDLLDIWSHTILTLKTIDDSCKIQKLFNAYEYYNRIKTSASLCVSTQKKVWLLGIPICTINKKQNTTKMKLFNIIPFIKIK